MSDIPLREYTERRLDDLEAKFCLRFDLEAKALSLQAKEVERRLIDLNHAHAKAAENFNTYLPRAEYGLDKEQLRVWKETIEAWRNKTIGYAIGAATLGGATGALAAKLFGS